MTKVNPNYDLKEIAENSQRCKKLQKPVSVIKMTTIYDDLEEAEKDIYEGKLVDARHALKELRIKYRL